MNSQQPPVPAATLITQYLPLAEKILLAGLAVGAIMMAMGLDTNVTSGSLIGLAVIFFLSAYRPLDAPRPRMQAARKPRILQAARMEQAAFRSYSGGKSCQKCCGSAQRFLHSGSRHTSLTSGMTDIRIC